jgi:hypothetical protein
MFVGSDYSRQSVRTTSREQDRTDFGERLRIFGLVEDETVSAESLRTTLRKMSGQLQMQIHPTRAAAVRTGLTENIPAVRSLLRAMTELPIKGSPTERAIAGLTELKTLYARHETELPLKDRDLAKGWEALVDGATDRERAMRALEMSTLFELRRGLRRGGCWLEYSNAYRNREQMLIPEEQWRAQRRRHLSLLRLPENPKEYVASLVAAAKQGLDAVSRALARGELAIDEGDIRLPKLEKEDVPPPVTQARDAITTHIGTIQLPELLLDMDVQTRFGKTLLGRAPRSEHELLLTYGALLGHGTEMNATEVALMIPSLSAPEISAAMKLLEGEGAIDKANKLVVEFVDRLPIMKVWGDGKSASSDMMSLQASMHLWNARRDPRRKTASMGMYTHVLNQWPIIYHQPIVLGNRQAGAAIEGVVRQDRIDLDWLAVDTHGYVVIWTPRRFRRRSLNQPIYMCVCFRRSGYASHQEAYVERRDIDHSDRRVGHTGRRGKRVSCVPVRSRVLAQHEYRLCARSFPLVAVPRRATPELVRDQARPYRRVPTVSPSRDNAASVAVYRAEACGRR